ncbi:MAG: homoserine dehydrogenase [Candidatus Izemoplasmatales bacterium]
MKLAFIGFGHVGNAFYEMVKDTHEVVSILVHHPKKLRREDIKNLFYFNEEDLFLHDFDCLIEVSAHEEPALDLMKRALAKGKHVVSSNKAAVAKGFYELQKLAKENNCLFLFEGSTMSGMPVIQTMYDLIRSDEITSMHGIVNGSTNYCLTKIFRDGYTFQEAFDEAMELGYLESDPTDDLDGFDSMRKMLILSDIAYHGYFTKDQVSIQALSSISQKMIDYVKKHQLIMRYIIVSEKRNNEIVLKVEVVAFGKDILFSSVNDEKNILYINTMKRGPVILIGSGAGGRQTASGVLLDLVKITDHEGYHFEETNKELYVKESSLISNYYVETEEGIFEKENLTEEVLKASYPNAKCYVRVKKNVN